MPPTYGIEHDLQVSLASDGEGVEVPPTDIGLSDEQMEELQSTVDPLKESQEFGIDLYLQTVQLILSFNISES